MLRVGVEVLKLSNLHLEGSNRAFLLLSGSQQLQFFRGSQQFLLVPGTCLTYGASFNCVMVCTAPFISRIWMLFVNRGRIQMMTNKHFIKDYQYHAFLIIDYQLLDEVGKGVHFPIAAFHYRQLFDLFL